MVIREALTIGPRDTEDTVTPHTRPPTDSDTQHMLVRTAVCLEGMVEIELVCEPAFDYGRVPAEWSLADATGHMADASGAGQAMRLQTDMALGIEGSRVHARHVLSKGDQVFCSLSWAESMASPGDAQDAAARIDTTVRFWRDWLAAARIPDHRWRHPLERSALAIKGLTYFETAKDQSGHEILMNDTPQAAAAFQKVAADPRFDVALG